MSIRCLFSPLGLLVSGCFCMVPALGADLLDPPFSRSTVVVIVPSADDKKELPLDALLKPLLSIAEYPKTVLRLSLEAENATVPWKEDFKRPATERMPAQEYLKHLAEAAGLACTLRKAAGEGFVLEVATEVDIAGKDVLLRMRRSDEAEVMKELKRAMMAAGWESNATWEEVSEDVGEAPGTPTHMTVSIHGTAKLGNELLRHLDPLTSGLQEADRLPLGYPFTDLPEAPITIPAEWLETENVPLHEAVRLLEVPGKLVVEKPEALPSHPLSFKSLPKSWCQGALSQAAYTGLLKWLGVTLVLEKGTDSGKLHVDLWPANKAQAKTDANALPEMDEAEFSHLVHLLRTTGWRGDVACLRGEELPVKREKETPKKKRWIIGSKRILEVMRQSYQNLRELSVGGDNRLPLGRPLENISGQPVTAPEPLWLDGTTVALAVAPLAKLRTGQIDTEKKLVLVTTNVSPRISESVIQIPEDPPGLFRTKLEPTLYLRLLQEAGLEFAGLPAATAYTLHVTGASEAASTATIETEAADDVNFPYVVAQLQRQNLQTDLLVKAGPNTADPTKVERAYTGPPAAVAAIKTLQVEGKPEIKAPSETALETVATADEVATWEFPLRYAQVATLVFVDVESGGEIKVPGVKELLVTLVGQANKDKDDNLITNVPSILEHPRRNAMLITDYRNRESFYRTLIAQLDRPRSLIEVSISVLDLTSDLDEAFGSELMIGSGAGGRPDVRLGSGAGTDLNPVLNALNSPGGPSRPAGFNTGLVERQGFSIAGLIANSRTQVLGRLSVLEGAGKVRVEARPALRTLSGLEASFSDSSKTYVIVPGANIGTTFEVPVTTKIKVLPREGRRQDGTRVVHMVVTALDSAVVTTVQTNNIATPVISSGSVTAQAEVPDGGSLLLGGRYRHVEAEVESNAPFLKTIPGVKHLFQRKVLSEERTQRFFLISPRIVPVTAASGISMAVTSDPPVLEPLPPGVVGDKPVSPKKPNFFQRLFKTKK